MSTTLGRAIAKAPQDRALIRTHPFDRRELGQSAGADHQVDLTANPGHTLEFIQAVKRGESLRGELGDVVLYLGLGTQTPAKRSQHEADPKHTTGVAYS